MVRHVFFAPLCIRRFFGAKKACPLLFFFVFFSYILFSLVACTDSSDPETVVYPRDKELYAIFPNDPILGDSVEAHLSTGIMLLVHPGGLYTLSFDVDPAYEAPRMQLFRFYENRRGDGYGMSKTQTLKPEVIENRYVFTFICEENEKSSWALTLVQDDDYYRGKTRDLKFEGFGEFSDTLSLNLISVGLIDPIDGVPDIDSLARLLVEGFRESYTTIVIDTIYVNEASEHPNLGVKYPPDRHWYAGSSSDDQTLSELGSWPAKGVTEALDIVLVHRIDELNVLGHATLFAANLKGGEGSTVVVGSHVLTASGERSLSAEEIVKGNFAAIVAPSFTTEAKQILSKNKKTKLVPSSKITNIELEARFINGGILIQTKDNTLFNQWKVRTKNRPSQVQTDEMVFGMLLAMGARSYSAVLLKQNHICGIAQGCTSEKRAIDGVWFEALKFNERASGEVSDQFGVRHDLDTSNLGEVLVTDGAIPFADTTKKLIDSGVKAILQTGGTPSDDEFIDYCNEHGVVMVFTGMTHLSY